MVPRTCFDTLSAAPASDPALLDTADRGVALRQTSTHSMTAFAFATLCPRCGGVVASDVPKTELDANNARWHHICASLTLAEVPDLRRALRVLTTRLMEGALGGFAPLLDEVLDACTALAPCDDMGLPVSHRLVYEAACSGSTSPD